MTSFLPLLKSFATSKKAVAAIGGVIVALAAKYGLQLDETAVLSIVGVTIAYVTGQGIADAGKEAAKIMERRG